MSGTETTEIAVVGAGVVGLAVALRLAQEGREVVMVDPGEPGAGASYGNAGTIADYAVMPVGTPDVLRNLPSLLFDASSPLAIRRAAILGLAPWLVRFLRQSLPAAARRNAAAIAALLGDAAFRWQALAAEAEASALLQDRGALYLYDTEKALISARADMAARRALGVSVDLIGPAELAVLEPGLPGGAAGAALFPKARFLTDPALMMAHLARAAAAAGVRHRRFRVLSLGFSKGSIRLAGEGHSLQAARVVIAAGAHSRPLALMAGDRVPLETERGYHVEYDMAVPRLTRPTCPTARGFYLCPMAGRLRVAGTVELGGLTPRPSAHRIARLTEGARAIFPDLAEPSRTWLGFRPSLPDSLPVIGPSTAGPQVLYAFGHGHIGVTLAPITAAIIADLVAGRTPPVDLAPTSVRRFRSG